MRILSKITILVFLAVFLCTFNSYALPIAGSSSGTFTNPVGPSTMVTTGVGTNNFTWGKGYYSPSSSMQFNGATDFSTQTDSVFSFGTLTYFNGAIFSNTGANAVDLDIVLSLTNPEGVAQDFGYNLQLINTTNTNDPNSSADYVNFSNTFDNTYFTVDNVDYTLEFLGFGEISGSGFSSINEFHVLEGESATAELFGRITATPGAAPVPEPATLFLLGTGLLGFAGARRKKNK